MDKEPEQTPEGSSDEEGKGSWREKSLDMLREAAGKAGQVAGDTIDVSVKGGKQIAERAGRVTQDAVDKATGVEFRREFEEFVDAVTTSILGIHRDLTELQARLERLEKSRERKVE